LEGGAGGGFSGGIGGGGGLGAGAGGGLGAEAVAGVDIAKGNGSGKHHSGIGGIGASYQLTGEP
jgi:hypothetical protein